MVYHLGLLLNNITDYQMMSGSFTIVDGKEYTPDLNDKTSLEYLQLRSEVIKLVSNLYIILNLNSTDKDIKLTIYLSINDLLQHDKDKIFFAIFYVSQEPEPFSEEFR